MGFDIAITTPIEGTDGRTVLELLHNDERFVNSMKTQAMPMKHIAGTPGLYRACVYLTGKIPDLGAFFVILINVPGGLDVFMRHTKVYSKKFVIRSKWRVVSNLLQQITTIECDDAELREQAKRHFSTKYLRDHKEILILAEIGW
ncbi:hypothetical protein ONZ43_g7219 [Nemania bipapillata]|uniref:Uncharacterized protein n=1 Tax=Nemania bipapillata TaxID=110536 RepID=A0ACC2HSX3_9PEZI|nr:hypothetical protein ONZ43_g7219 [Nemania bipapillata]